MSPGARDGHPQVMSEESARTLDGFVSSTQVAAAKRVAKALTAGFAMCEEAGFPLSERQRVSMLTAAFLAFDGFHAETERLLHVDQLISDLRFGDLPES
jgi:hypothetical protein